MDEGAAPAHAGLTRRELFDRIWSKSMTANAVELGTTTWTLSALAKRLGLPLPRAGHWMKKEVGKEPPTPEYPADSALDDTLHAIPAAPVRRSPSAPVVSKSTDPALMSGTQEGVATSADTPQIEESASAEAEFNEHKKVVSTRTAIRKSRAPGRAAIGGTGKFRLLIAPASAERALAILDRLLAAIEARGWSLESSEQGYALVAEGEMVGFMIEEKLEPVPHVATAAELKEKADYERKCALADRGIGYRPWRAPMIPTHDHVPNGELVLKFDHDYAAAGIRKTYSDGKRQRLENLIPSIIDALARRAAAVKANREARTERERQWAEQERRRKDRERQARVEGYRIVFLQAQIARQREIDGLSGLIARWEAAEETDAKFAELLAFARLYRSWLVDRIAPEAIAKRIAELKLMEDDIYIYDAKRLD